jgi:hypothetical protein
MNPELTEDYTARTKLFGLRYWFGYAGTFAFTAFSLAVFFVADEVPAALGTLNRLVDRLLLLGFGLGPLPFAGSTSV